MRTLLLTLCACALFLQSCGQKTDQASTSSSTSTDTAAPSGESKAGDGKMPESQKLFMESADKLKNGDAKGCDETLDKAAAAAEKEGDGVDYIHIKETQARLRMQQKDSAAGTKILEDLISKYDKSTDQRVTQRLDATKFLLAKIYSSEGNKAKANEIFDKFEGKMGLSAAAAKGTKNIPAYLQIREAQARLKAERGDFAGAKKLLNEEIKAYGAQAANDAELKPRMEMFKTMVISLTAREGKTAEADKQYKALIDECRKAKPVDHRRLAFALHEYAEFMRFSKHEKEADKIDTEAKAELDKK